jgi:hypothetical protein
LHLAGSQRAEATRVAAAELDAGLGRLQGELSEGRFQDREQQILAEILDAGDAGV